MRKLKYKVCPGEEGEKEEEEGEERCTCEVPGSRVEDTGKYQWRQNKSRRKNMMFDNGGQN